MPIPEFQGERIIPGEPMVDVELVIDRPMKDDCRNYTKVVWLGRGDVQQYPARLWPKLAVHPDVWRLAGSGAPLEPIASAAPAAAPAATKTYSAAEVEALLAEQAKRLTSGVGDLTGTAVVPPGAGGTISQTDDPDGVLKHGFPDLSAEELAGMSDEEVRGAAAMRRLGLHARLQPDLIRPKFLELQAAKAAARAGAGS